MELVMLELVYMKFSSLIVIVDKLVIYFKCLILKCFIIASIAYYSTSCCNPDLRWVASFDGPSAFLTTLLILYFCCVLIQVLLLCGK